MIVGLGHVARTGKDSSANALQRDLHFRRVGFADRLKELALHADPLIVANSQINIGIGRGKLAWLVQSVGGWEQAKTAYPEVRKFLQNLGLGARKVFGEDFWLNQTLDPLDPAADWVVPDVRFLNEAEAIRARGGLLVKIDRPGYRAAGHISETELAEWDGWDAVVVNDSTLIELEARIVHTVRGLLQKRELVGDGA